MMHIAWYLTREDKTRNAFLIFLGLEFEVAKNLKAIDFCIAFTYQIQNVKLKSINSFLTLKCFVIYFTIRYIL